VNREELKRLTKEEVGRRIREGVKAVIEQVLKGGDAKGHGGLGFPVLPGHRPTLGRGRETHKNRDLTCFPFRGTPSGWRLRSLFWTP
jgi:hypothetical protein